MIEVWNTITAPVRKKDGRLDPMQVFFAIATPMMVFLFSVLIYWYWFDTPRPVVIESAVVENTVVEKGDLLKYRISGCRYTDAAVTINRYWIDGLSLEMPETPPEPFQKGCFDQTRVSLVVPGALPPGNYSVKVAWNYIINPIQTRQVVFWLGPIEVIE